MSGHLKKNECSRFELAGVELSCGSPLEIQIAGQWVAGRVEHTPRLGYFWTDGTGVCVALNDHFPARLSGQRRGGGL